MPDRRPFSAVLWDERESWPCARLLEEQDRRLREQLARIAKASPFYRARFADIGLEPGDLRSVEDLAGLPLTRKADVAGAIATAPP